MEGKGERRSKVIVVLPAYNEEANLGPLLERLEEAMEEAELRWEAIVVDDGSTDGTAEVLSRYQGRLPLTVERHERNQGLGATTRDGVLIAAGRAAPNDIVVTMDSDETHTPGLILRMVRMVREGHDVVIASRYREGSRVYGLSWRRRLTSWAGSMVFRVLFPTAGVRDYTCGYRAYRAAALQRAVAQYGEALVTADGFQCMVDLLLKLREMHLIFGEVPLILRYDLKKGKSKMRLGRTAIDTLALALRRRLG